MTETKKLNTNRLTRRDRLKGFWQRCSTWQKWVLRILGFLLAWPVVMTLVYAVVPPPVSNLMLMRALSGNGINKQWMKLDQMSPQLARAVISSEDARFCSHHGVDWVEFADAFGGTFDDFEAPSRGASTVSMQTAKNMFLWDGRGSGIRKLFEMPLALYMDLIWTKHRMLEVYLNIVEWGPGIYGAEAASQYHFKKSAAQLTRREASLLAAVLPNPIKRNAGKPSKRVNFTAARIQMRMNDIDAYLTCIH
ncbi:MAG: monofunctional biosynthetic peptidoglycan transglycosylase [Alphaproteobacteria bacterium]|nr:monofunctional biosynthetic peptidoglycan transglycosylase [Alphaproteobacteria bacterium]